MERQPPKSSANATDASALKDKTAAPAATKTAKDGRTQAEKIIAALDAVAVALDLPGVESEKELLTNFVAAFFEQEDIDDDVYNRGLQAAGVLGLRLRRPLKNRSNTLRMKMDLYAAANEAKTVRQLRRLIYLITV